ncbi:PPOX class F420-dependent protein [Mycolicibacterium conceptionense]|uniref:PPOX class F420-dependent protein n=1 Tax=Mycolicibacterium conceptionense TaxID=451644 RepID=A0A0U1CV31_9MYCO|nr:PPOX class F420-dependent protein [Mycolicibacterium conceptionense]
MARKYATADRVDIDELLDFVRPRHHMVLTTFRVDGSLQTSPVTGGVDDEGRIVIASYPQRAKAANLRRTPRASVTVLSEEFNGPYVQVDGDAR